MKIKSDYGFWGIDQLLSREWYWQGGPIRTGHVEHYTESGFCYRAGDFIVFRWRNVFKIGFQFTRPYQKGDWLHGVWFGFQPEYQHLKRRQFDFLSVFSVALTWGNKSL